MNRAGCFVALVAFLFVLTVITVVFMRPPAPEPQLEQFSFDAPVSDKMEETQ